MFCRKCGNKLKEGARFCNKCGTQIVSPSGAEAQQSYGSSLMPGAESPKNHDKKGHGPLIAVAAVLVLVLLAGGAFAVSRYVIPALNQKTSAAETKGKKVIDGREKDGWDSETEETEETEKDMEPAEEAENGKDSGTENVSRTEKETETETESAAETETEKQEQGWHDSTDIHRYEIITGDVSWVEAYKDCASRGGYLVHLNSREEAEAVTKMIESQGLQNGVFWVGAVCFDGGNGKNYYWVNPDGSLGDVSLTMPESGISDYWMSGEPSFSGLAGDGKTIIPEEYVDMFFYKKENRYVLNDVPGDIASYYPGRVAYICEYEN